MESVDLMSMLAASHLHETGSARMFSLCLCINSTSCAPQV